jgi:hypothetical protein
MYYEERIIDGVLCSRSAPDGEWTQKTAKELTERLILARQLAGQNRCNQYLRMGQNTVHGGWLQHNPYTWMVD